MSSRSLHIRFIFITAAAPITMRGTIFNLADRKIVCHILWFARQHPFTLSVDEVKAGFICHGFCHEILLPCYG